MLPTRADKAAKTESVFRLKIGKKYFAINAGTMVLTLKTVSKFWLDRSLNDFSGLRCSSCKIPVATKTKSKDLSEEASSAAEWIEDISS